MKRFHAIAATGTFWLGEAADNPEVWALMCRRSMAACILAASEGVVFGNAMQVIEDKEDPRSGHFLHVAQTALDHLDYLPPRPTP